MNLKDFFTTVAAKAGIDLTAEELKTALSTGDFSKVDIPQATVDRINEALMTEDAAQIHPKVANAIKARALNTFDEKLPAWLQGLLDDSEIEGIKNAKTGTYQRVENGLTAVKTKLEAARAELAEAKKSGSKADQAEVQSKINELNGQVKQLQDALKAKDQELSNKLAEKESELMATTRDMFLRMKVMGHKWAAMYPETVRGQVGMSLIQAKLAEAGYQIKTDELGNISLLTKDGNPPLDKNNQTVKFDDFFSRTMQEAGFTDVSGGGQGQGNPGGQQQQAGSGGQQVIKAQSGQERQPSAQELAYQAKIEATLKAME